MESGKDLYQEALREKEAYKQMYLDMVRASEKAINMLISAQQKCEQQYLNMTETPEDSSPSEGEA